jgi:hypothetical protein
LFSFLFVSSYDFMVFAQICFQMKDHENHKIQDA